jgi:hypothetical protein
LAAGTGQTVNLSSHGILFEAKQKWLTGCNIELTIAWPARRDPEYRLELIVSGAIVRARGDLAAIRMRRHALRVVGTPALRRAGEPELAGLSSGPR